jgi:lipopolysaccharide/colanic/teichoic acid biosynthesis glycosyltransferase
VFFWQQRMGLNIRRFRTLSALSDEHGNKLTDDQRLSRMGSFMRRTRLDELPQLLWSATRP